MDSFKILLCLSLVLAYSCAQNLPLEPVNHDQVNSEIQSIEPSAEGTELSGQRSKKSAYYPYAYSAGYPYAGYPYSAGYSSYAGYPYSYNYPYAYYHDDGKYYPGKYEKPAYFAKPYAYAPAPYSYGYNYQTYPSYYHNLY